MTEPVYINLAFEDALSEAVLRKLLHVSHRCYQVHVLYGGKGSGYLKQRISAFNNAAKGVPYLVLADLDTYSCPPDLLNAWLPRHRSSNLLFRVAVREVEAWLLADRRNLARFLGVQIDLIPLNSENLADPKAALINLARHSRHGELRKDICPPSGSTSQIGPGYNGRMSGFVADLWDPRNAALCCTSLSGAIRALDAFAFLGTEDSSQ